MNADVEDGSKHVEWVKANQMFCAMQLVYEKMKNAYEEETHMYTLTEPYAELSAADPIDLAVENSMDVDDAAIIEFNDNNDLAPWPFVDNNDEINENDDLAPWEDSDDQMEENDDLAPWAWDDLNEDVQPADAA